jgi:hypothetical protein
MARVFTQKQNTGVAKMLIIAVVIIAIAVGIWYTIGLLQNSQDEESIKIAKDSVVRATVQCYALEGRYPPGIDYLKDNYGLTLNEDKYVYYYQSIGENLMPDIRVFSLKGMNNGS